MAVVGYSAEQDRCSYRVLVDAVWAAVVGAVVGAVFGALGAIATTSWVTRRQLIAQARFRAEDHLRVLLRGLKARLEIERRAKYPTISTNSGPFDIDHREQLAIEVIRNLADLRRDEADAIRAAITTILGEDAVLFVDARAALPGEAVDVANERATKSIELIRKLHAGTMETGLVPQIARHLMGDPQPAFDAALGAIDGLLDMLRPRQGRWRTARWFGE